MPWIVYVTGSREMIRMSLIYASTVMTSFDYIVNTNIWKLWFQTNTLEHELDDRADNTVSYACVTNEKNMALQRQI